MSRGAQARRVRGLGLRLGVVLTVVVGVWGGGVLGGTARSDTPLRDFRVVPSDGAATVMWYPRDEPSGATIRIGTEAPATPDDGTAACVEGVSPCRITDLANEVMYHVAAFPPAGGAAVRAEVTPRDIVAPREVDALGVVRRDRALIVTWTDPPVPDLDHAVVRHRSGRKPPTLQGGAGGEVPRGVGRFRVDGLTPGVWHSFAVFTVDEASNTSYAFTTAAKPVARTRVTLRPSSRSVPKGATVRLRGTVRASTGVLIPRAKVQLLARYPRRATSVVAAKRTNAHGVFVMRHAPRRTVTYAVRYLARDPYLSSQSRRIRVTVTTAAGGIQR